ncbi:MAG: hypothetical protein NZ895_02395 [Archaeoglobaceae archaeon]|nr:hypothetical protein [Archaeoglobaceae archaeon]MCX8152699.1 hypothetical protein [Archaeoglobaceae archaeon]MDW8013265.1 hypothetical protein [Archaeoglobaceae archaeon]
MKIFKFALITVELTSLPLIFLAFLYVLTGYQMLVPEIAVMPARRIHADPVMRMLLIVLGTIHAYAGLLILCERRFEKFRKILATIATVFVAIFILLIATLEILLKF